MSYPIQVTFLNMHHSDLLEDIARNYAEKLSRYYSRISRVKIAIEVPHKNHNTGNTFQVKIDIAVPGTKVCIATNADSRLDQEFVKTGEQLVCPLIAAIYKLLPLAFRILAVPIALAGSYALGKKIIAPYTVGQLRHKSDRSARHKHA